MPRGDGPGPAGMGPVTGRGAGVCAGFAMPGFMNSLPGWERGMGRGRGCGRGMGRRRLWAGWGYPPAAYPETVPRDEIEMLKERAARFGEALDKINKRIAELETEKK
jgi:hypothetical protein